MNREIKRIGILDHMGWGNFGDSAAQEAFISLVKQRIPDVAIVGFSLSPADTRTRHNIPAYPITWSYPGRFGSESQHSAGEVKKKALFKSILIKTHLFHTFAKPVHDCIQEAIHLVRSFWIVRSLDLLVISGGGQLCDLWHGPWSHPYNIFKFAVMAKMSRKALYILNVGAGPLEHPLSKFFARWSVRLADYASFRNDESQKLLKNLGIKKKTYVCPDMVYSLDLKQYHLNSEIDSPRPIVGLNPMSFCDPRVWPRKDKAAYNIYLDKIVSLSSWLLSKNYKLEIFSTDIEVDKFAIEDLKNKLLHKWPEEIILNAFLPPKLELKDLIYQMARFDFIITPKFHGVIFSHLLNKPVIALKYSPKTLHLMKAVGHEQYCHDIEQFDVNTVTASIDKLINDSGVLKKMFSQAVKEDSSAIELEFDELFGSTKMENQAN